MAIRKCGRQTSGVPRVLIGTLFSGENEFEQCKAALSEQLFQSWDHIVIEGLPEWEAHVELYSRFMACATEYSYFVKLDPDMVFMDELSLGAALEVLDVDQGIGRAQFALSDWASGLRIMGLHVYRSDARWCSGGERVFPDLPPVTNGRSVNVWGDPSPVAMHSPEPNPLQAFRYGASRAQKLLKGWPSSCNPIPGGEHWKRLVNIWQQFKERGDRRRGLALLGADAVFASVDRDHWGDYGSEYLRRAFADAEGLSDSEVMAEVSKRWNGVLNREMRHVRLVGWRSVVNVPRATCNMVDRVVRSVVSSSELQ